MEKRHRAFWLLAMALSLVLFTGCGFRDGPKEETKDFWTSADGLLSLPIKESQWDVEENGENEYTFTLKEDRRLVLFLSKWEDMKLPPSFDFEAFLEEYARGIMEGRLQAKLLRMETAVDASGTTIGLVEMKYEEETGRYHVSLALVPKGESVFVFTMMNPADISEKSAEQFDKIVTNIQFLKEP